MHTTDPREAAKFIAMFERWFGEWDLLVKKFAKENLSFTKDRKKACFCKVQLHLAR
jgi:hypothetical protein